MSDTIGSLVIDLVANTANFSNQLTAARKSVEDFASGIKSVFGGLGAVFSIGGIAELTKNTLDFGDQLQKSIAKTGLGATAISELAFAARQANIDLPEFTSSIDKMEKSISTATTGTGTSKAAFDALGISLAQITTLSPDQQFEEIANQINKLPTPTDKARAALEIFGRAGADLLPLFEQGAAGIELARQKAVDFGASLSSDQLQKLATANTAVKDLGASFSALATTLIAKVAPGISGFFDSITNLVTGNQIALITKQIEVLQGQLAYAQGDGTGGPAVAELQGQIAKAQIALDGAKLAKQIADNLAKPGDLVENQAPGFLPDIKPIEINPNLKIQTDAMTKFYIDLDDATKTGAEKVVADTDTFQKQLNELIKAGIITVSESFNRLHDADNAKSLSDLLTTNSADISAAYKQMQDDLVGNFKVISDSSKLAGENMKADFDKTVANAKQSAQSIEDAFATFLVDPFSGGLKKMLSAWVQTIDQMVAKAAAQSIFKSLFGDSGGLGSIFASFLGGGSTSPGVGTDFSTAATIGFATGGSFKVGGTGGTDSQLVKFKASPDETVTITTPGQAAASAIPSVTFSPVYNVGSGVSRTDVIQACAATQKATLAQVTRLIRGGAYG